MKKALLSILFAGLLPVSTLFAQDVICYPENDKQIVDFWLDHHYYAVCTDYQTTGGKLFAENEDYIDFNGGGTIDFTDIYVSQDGDYTVTLWYGVGYADEEGATLTVNVNGEFYDQLVIHTLQSDPPAMLQFDVELWENYSNTIQFQQVKDWPTMYRIQLTSNNEPIDNIAHNDVQTYNITSATGGIQLEGLTGNSEIEVYSITGAVISASVTSGSTLNIPLVNGLYIVKVNGKAHKVVIK